MGAQAGVAATSPRVLVDHRFWRGVRAGLIPNAVIFAAIYSTAWVDEHVGVGLALGVLYGGPVAVGLVGLLKLAHPGGRQYGAGLILAAAVTVGSWFLFVYIDTLVSMSANTPGP